MVDTPSGVPFVTETQLQEVKNLVQLAGLDIREESISAIYGLLVLGAAPNSLATVLSAICKPPGSASVSKRFPVQSSSLSSK